MRTFTLKGVRAPYFILKKNPLVARKINVAVIFALSILLSTEVDAQLNVAGGTSTSLYGLSASAVPVDPLITITSGSNINGFKITISSGLQSSDVLSYTASLPSGISATAYNSSTGVLEFTGSTTAANWQTLLRTVSFSNSNTSQAGDRTITFSAGTSSAFSNGHYYELISSGMSWTSAKAAAEARSYLGYSGYLATISSVAENNFIRQVLNADAWIGASDEVSLINASTGTSTYANQAAAEGKWYWVTGPEKGTFFSNGNSSPVAVSSNYMNWNSGEPNNSGPEHYGQIYSSGSNPGVWNDLRNTNSLGYVVEYGGLPTDPVQTISSNTTLRTLITGNSLTGAQSICNGVTPSTITGSAPKGGNGTYTYRWICSTTSTSSGFSLAPGTATNQSYSPGLLSSTTHYRRVVNSGVQTDTSTAISIIVNPALTSSITQTNVSCNGGSNGVANMVVSGGSGSISYSWSPTGGATAIVSGLSAGSYTCIATDAAGCTASRGVTLSQPTALAATQSQTNVRCNGNSNGAASVTPSGGTSPYLYNWSNGSSVSSITALLSGNYSCTITDANGCTTSRSFTITQPTVFVTSASSINPSCNGLTNGSINVSTSGGTFPYTYQWSNSSTTSSISGLGAATYTCTITDANSCSKQVSSTLTQPSGFGLGGGTSSPSCFGGTNGSAFIIVSGGTFPYSYNWSAGSTSAIQSSLSPGTYTCSITDANSCTTSRAFTVTAATAIGVGSTVRNVFCNGESNGRITLNVSGGAGGFSYLWSNGSTSQSQTNLTAGNYSVTITDGNGCTATRSYTVTQPNALASTGSQTNINCFGASTGSASISLSGGTTPYTYSWSSSLGSSTTVSNLAAGTYTCSMFDANGCTTNRSFILTQPSAMSAATSQTNVTCNGLANGAASATISGGTAPYSYNWTGGGNTNSKSNLAAGTYTISVQDANLCPAYSYTFTITQPAALSVASSQTNIDCNGSNSGSAVVNVSGGTAPYTYSWSSGETTNNINSLIAGVYSCTIQDANNCPSSVETFTITQPSILAISTSITNVDCFGSNTGSAYINLTGGTTPYSYLWNDGSTNDNLISLFAGSYSCDVVDANGCTQNASFYISEPNEITASNTVTQISCNGYSDGEITIIPIGGTDPYQFVWNNSSTTSNSQSGLSEGTYLCTITDNNGCTLIVQSDIIEPDTIACVTTVTDPTCNGNTGMAVLNPNGGTAPYSYDWGNGNTSNTDNSILAGIYNVLIIDNNGCSKIETVTINEPSAINVSTFTTDPLCYGQTGSCTAIATGGTGNLSYEWSTGGTTNSETGLYAGLYVVTVTDDNGCNIPTLVGVVEPDTLIANVSTTNPTCYGGLGTATISAIGGTGNYYYSWITGDSTSSVSNLLAFPNYTCSITDDNGCSASLIFDITEPSQILSIVTSVDEHCNLSDGEIMLTTSGGTGQLSILWDNGDTTAVRTLLSSGSYSYTITDENFCSISGTTTLNNLPPPSVNSIVNNITCNGMNDGSIDLTTTQNGPLANSISWNNGENTEDIFNLGAGLYIYELTGSYSCVVIDTLEILDPAAISVNANVTNVTTVNDGAIELTISGGTPSYSYLWSNGEIVEDISGLAAGDYTVTITDINGCTSSYTVTVSSSVGVTEFNANANNVIIYPNPNKGVFEMKGGLNGIYIILNSIGQVVTTFNIIKENNFTVDVRNLSEGLYFIQNTESNLKTKFTIVK